MVNKKIKEEILGWFAIVMGVLILSEFIKVTGTKFFGIELLPAMILAVSIISLGSDKKNIEWILEKIEDVFNY